MPTCPALSTDQAFLSTLLRHIDCQAQSIGAGGYQALADPASPVSLALTGLLTIFIALFGLRMMLGRTPTVRDGMMAALKVGVVLTIAASWPAYRTVIYDIIVHGPTQLSTTLAGAAGLPGADGEPINRLQAADSAIIRLTTLGSGRNDLASLPPAAGAPGAAELERTPIADDPAFGAARVLFLSSTIAAFAVVRLTAGLLLALAPLFAGLLLFDMARGFFVGWVRALIFTMLASVAVTIFLGVELALLEPWLTQVLQLRQAKVITAAAPIELLVLCLAFALALVGSLAIILRLAFTVHISLERRGSTAPSSAAEPSGASVARSDWMEVGRPSPRIEAVASALATTVRRERADPPRASGAALAMIQTGRASPVGLGAGDDLAFPSPGQALRRTRSRKSVSATLRDRRS
jgi:type IV secretion system protein VirB6